MLIELNCCIKEMIQLKYFTLECLNQKIMLFPYQFIDKVARPTSIPKTLTSKGTIGGNGHENALLLRLLPLLVGSAVPETSGQGAVIMELKDLVGLALWHPVFTDETLDYLAAKLLTTGKYIFKPNLQHVASTKFVCKPYQK